MLKHQFGLGLRHVHLEDVLHTKSPIDFVEIHADNWFAIHSPQGQTLQQIKALYEVSVHGVGLSIANSTLPLSAMHTHYLEQLTDLIHFIQPTLVSDHLCISHTGKWHSFDLLPIPYHVQLVSQIANQIDHIQQQLGRAILIENISQYGIVAGSHMPEWEFLAQVVDKSNCGLLLDINNIYVNSQNFNFNPEEYLNAMPWHSIQEIHLAGHIQQQGVFIDTHSMPVCEAVLQLLRYSMSYIKQPTAFLLEWDTELPEFSVLLQEVENIKKIVNDHDKQAPSLYQTQGETA